MSGTIDALAGGGFSDGQMGFVEGLFDAGMGVMGGMLDVAQAAASTAIDVASQQSGFGMGFSVDVAAASSDVASGGGTDSLGLADNYAGAGYALIDLNNGREIGVYVGPSPWNTGGGGT